ncbi:hypothetical protein MITS9509_02807 [Synechococcus sp. MIT S9509]|nr:hypothetical protein MITS9504_02554 [Synechococcus sp. MIT S9504]KZR90122.1 hypothetical protein MITS9509_02807 [Synechococcus sp. MIT S9509]
MQRDVSAVWDVLFAIAPNEMVVFLRANRAGKTIMLSCLCLHIGNKEPYR